MVQIVKDGQGQQTNPKGTEGLKHVIGGVCSCSTVWRGKQDRSSHPHSVWVVFLSCALKLDLPIERVEIVLLLLIDFRLTGGLRRQVVKGLGSLTTATFTKLQPKPLVLMHPGLGRRTASLQVKSTASTTRVAQSPPFQN